MQTSINNLNSTFFSEGQLHWLKKAREFAAAIPLGEIIEADKSNVFRRDLFELACQEGFGALPFPTRYGGQAGDYVSFSLVNEEFGRQAVPIMSSLGVHVLCQEPIYRFGTEEQKKRYLIPSSSGRYLAAFALTEPAAGSDTKALVTTARLVGDEYILNGSKTFITSGSVADYYLVMAKLITSSKESHDTTGKTISAFLVERNFSGFQVGQKFEMLGMRGYATCEIVFSDLKVPKANILGEPGMGRKIALSSLAKGRVTIAAQALGWAYGALDVLTQHLSHLPSNSILFNSQATLLGQLAILIESAHTLTYQAAHSIDHGQLNTSLAAMAKIQATDVAMKVASESLSLLGLQGTKPELLVEKIFRDAKAGQIYEGTNQIQRLLIARHLIDN